MGLEILGLSFTEAGVQITFVEPVDFRANGMMQQRTLLVAATKDTVDDITDLHVTITTQVVDWLEDFAASPELADDEFDPDDERGMGE